MKDKLPTLADFDWDKGLDMWNYPEDICKIIKLLHTRLEFWIAEYEREKARPYDNPTGDLEGRIAELRAILGEK